MSEVINKEDLRDYVKCLVSNLKNICDPEKFDPNMRFRDGPKMIIYIEEDRGKIIIAHFQYLNHYHIKFPLFPKGKISEITDEDIKRFLRDETNVIEGITNNVYNLFNQLKK